LEGSNDGKAYTELFKVDGNVHEGWNFYSWEKAEYPKYRYYRFRGLGGTSGPCLINEVKFTGNEVIDNTDTTYDCPAELVMKGEENVVLGKPKYKGDITPVLESMSPRYGAVTGGSSVTFKGKNFSASLTDNNIVIDGIKCVVTAATTTSVTCTLGKRPGLPEKTLVMSVKGRGDVSTQGKLFYYIQKWSDDTTWGGEFAPMDGETVFVPEGMSLLVDVDKTAKLNAVLIEGSLIFEPHPKEDYQKYFDAHYIFVKGKNSYMEIGTEEHPYTSKLTITMHSKEADPYIPIYGNKVIGLRYGTLDIHGKKRDPTWTVLEKTTLPGSDKITMQRKVDW
jgi:hypothetical protein